MSGLRIKAAVETSSRRIRSPWGRRYLTLAFGLLVGILAIGGFQSLALYGSSGDDDPGEFSVFTRGQLNDYLEPSDGA